MGVERGRWIAGRGRLPASCALGLLTLAVIAGPALGRPGDPEDELRRLGLAFARRWEVPAQEAAPAWATRGDAPLMRFVQLADVHHTARREPELLRALTYLNDVVRPDWVVLTGDNVSGATVEHHRRLQTVLREHLAAPFCIVEGDNDRDGFAAVFGSSRWAFTSCGVRFVGLALDNDARGAGIGTFDGETLRWVRADLKAHAREPAVVFLHEPVAPPVFLDALRLGAVLHAAGNVSAVVAGHLHTDLELRQGAIVHITAPAVGPSASHGMKEFLVYPDGLVVRTHEVIDGRYAFAKKWQRVPFPAGLTARPDLPTFAQDARELPPRDPAYPLWLQQGHDRVLSVLRAGVERWRSLRGEQASD